MDYPPPNNENVNKTNQAAMTIIAAFLFLSKNLLFYQKKEKKIEINSNTTKNRIKSTKYLHLASTMSGFISCCLFFFKQFGFP